MSFLGLLFCILWCAGGVYTTMIGSEHDSRAGIPIRFESFERLVFPFIMTIFWPLVLFWWFKMEYEG